MIDSISIGSVRHIDDVKDKLVTEFDSLQEEGITLSFKKFLKGEYTFLDCNIVNYGSPFYTDKDTRAIFKHYLANILSDLIVNNWERDLLGQIIKKNYMSFSEQEKNKIMEYTLNIINNSLTNDIQYYQISRKTKVLQKITEFLERNNQLNIEGFINFQLKEYLSELRDAVEQAADEFLMEKEYKEFVRLLKYFVEIQDSRIDNVNVVFKTSGAFKILDKDFLPVQNEYLEGLLIDFSEQDVSYDDLLISALITIAPKKICIHINERKKYVGTIDMIENIFGDRIEICSECKHCKNSNQFEN